MRRPALVRLAVRGLVLSAPILVATSCLFDRGPTGPDPTAVTSIFVTSSGPAVVPVGGTLQLEAQPKNAFGEPLLGLTVSWQSLTQDLALVSPGGVVTGLAEGPVIITATSGGRTGSLSLTV
jgi:hypothetical protein